MTPEIILHTNYRPSMDLSAQDIGKHMKRLKLNDARGISKSNRSSLRKLTDNELALQDRLKTEKVEVSLKDEEFTSVDNPVLSFFGPATKNVIKRSERFTEQEYNLYEYGRIIDTEALAARAFTKKKGLMFRNGYELSSKNKKNIDYIEKRFREIAMVSRRPWQVILDEMATSLINLHNTFYVKVRKDSASSGKQRVDFHGKKLQPIAGIFVVPAETMVQKIDDAANVHMYRQWMPRNKWRDFSVDNVGHMFYNKRPGYTIGTPCLEPVRDDILALRRIEECVEKLIYKSLFPIIHVKVGTEKFPCKTLPDGTNEVDLATRFLEQMEEDGGLATNERVEIKAIGAESLALRIGEYLTYFKNRVYAGLGMSGMDFGEAQQTTKSSGEVLSQALADQVADYQKTFEQFMDVLIMELLLERGDYENELDLEEKDLVHFVFNPIDKSEKIAKESHILSLANAGLLMIDEAREELDYAERKFDPEKTVPFLLQQAGGEDELDNQKALVSHTAKVMPKPAAGGAKKPAAKKPAAKKTSAVKKKTSGAAKSAAQKAKPANKKKLKDLMMSDDVHKQSRIARVLRDCAADHLTFGMYETFAELEQDIEASLASKIMDSSLDMAINLMVESLALRATSHAPYQQTLSSKNICLRQREILQMKISNTKIKVEAIDFGGLKLADANKIKSIRVKVEASHSGMINKNNFLYVPSAMRDGVDSWIDNPVIYGHNSDNLKDVSKHLGYIDDAKYVHYEEFGQDVLDFDSIDDIISVLEEADARKLYDSDSEYKGLGHIELIATIDKPDAIKKILDGTYSDVQIGGDAKDVYCSICSQNIAKTKEICHSRGKVYDGVQAYWIGDQISYEELSFVETPADPHVKTVVLKDSESGYDNGKIKILDFVLYDTEEDIVKKIKPTEFMETANKLLAVRLHELGLQDSAEFNADQYAKLKDSDYLFAGDKVLPIHDQAHLLIAQEILESIDNEGVAVEDQLDLAPMKVVITKRNKRLFKAEQVVIADELQKISDSVKAEKVEVAADPVVVEDKAAGSKEYDIAKLNFKDDTYDGQKLADMDDDDLCDLRKKLPCEEWGVWELRQALSNMISATMSVDKMAEVVKGALNELFPGGMKTQDSYTSKRLVALEDEVEAYAAESDSLKTKLKTSLVHNILVAEGKLEDEAYKSKLMAREIVSLEDKLEDLFPGQVADTVAVEGDDVDNKNVDIQDAVVDNTDPVKETVKVEDGTEEGKDEVLTVVQIRDTYKKTMREKGLVAASTYIKDLSQKGKLPKHFKM